MILDDLDTPCVLIASRRMDENLRRMQSKARKEGVALRPHVKTHKSFDIARRQRDYGAQGIATATIGEAEAFARAGFDDIRIAYTLAGERSLRRVATAARTVRLSFCVDTELGARAASRVFEEEGVEVAVLVEVDVGHHRTGLQWDGNDLPGLVRVLTDLPGIRLRGILTHGGHGYHPPERGETPQTALARRSIEERDRMLHVASRLGREGLLSEQIVRGFEVSIGSTPTMRYFENRTVDGWTVTEVRPGNYVYNDAIQVGLKAAELKDCALTVLATVVSRHRDPNGSERLYIDAGKKVLGSDAAPNLDGFGILLYNAETMTALPHARIVALSEEHGWIQVLGGATLNVGDRVRLVPNHACIVVALHQDLHLVDGEDVIGSVHVDARDAR